MKPNDTPENSSSKNNKNESAMDKIAEKTKELFSADDENKRGLKAKEDLLEGNFQNTPDEGSAAVPHEDKIAKDSKTGEETFIKNDNKR